MVTLARFGLDFVKHNMQRADHLTTVFSVLKINHFIVYYIHFLQFFIYFDKICQFDP